MKVTFKVRGTRTKKVIHAVKSFTFGYHKEEGDKYAFPCYIIHLFGKTIYLDKVNYDLLVVEDDDII